MRPGGRLVASAGVLTSDTSRGALTEQFVIEGGVPLSGTVRPEGNKNGALPILAACLLTEEEVRLSNVPRIRDVEIMAELVAHTGADVEWVGQNELVVRADRIERTQLDRELCSRIRASILLAGPLLAREGTVDVPPPGGDVIGRRRVDTHFHAFRGLGAIVTMGRDFAIRSPGGLRGARIFLDEPSVTGTENAIMAAVLAPGTTRLRQHGLRAARAGPVPDAREAWAPASRASAPTC